MSVRDDLIAAKALIDTPEKWTKGGWKNSAGCYCAFGALVATLTPPLGKDAPNGWRRKEACVNVLDGAAPVGGFITYNDHPDTTHADIMALFDRAINASPPVDGETGK